MRVTDDELEILKKRLKRISNGYPLQNIMKWNV
jgi:hypothetical protein